MGISGLLPFLKDAIDVVHLKQLEGCVVAVDTYCWIYKGAFSCAEQLALGQHADGHIKYVLKYVQKLLEWNIKPIMVFDGCCLPSKKNTELKRREQKEMYRKKAAQCLIEGKRHEARECFQRCIEVTQKMAHEVIQALHNIGVDVIVAPYEADAQLTYLSKMNIANVVITEDSDLILFGCKKILYKLDLNGNGNLLDKEKINSITQFECADNFERFRWMCILSGCDYLENLPGIGLGKAKKLLKQTKKTDIEAILKQLPQLLKMPKLIVSEEYIDKFIKAEKTFKHQIVFDPINRKLIPLNEYGPDIVENEDISYAGYFYENEIALELSLGNLDVNNKNRVDNFDPNNWKYRPPFKYAKFTPNHMKSIWSSDYSINNLNYSVKLEENTENVPIERPNTQGMEKVIDTNSALKRKVQSDTSLMKRKLNESVSDKNKDDELNESTQKQKKRKYEDIKCDIDQLLDEYKEDGTENDESKFDESSSYFSTHSSFMSPVLRKSSQKPKVPPSQSNLVLHSLSALNTTDTTDNENLDSTKTSTTPLKQLENENSDTDKILRVPDSDTKSNATKRKNVFAVGSPIVAGRSAYFSNTTDEDNTENELNNSIVKKTENVRKDLSNLFEPFQKTKTKEINSVKQVITQTVCEVINVEEEQITEITRINSKRSMSPVKATSKQQTSKQKKQQNNEQIKTRPISDFFVKFEHNKNSSNKFTK